MDGIPSSHSTLEASSARCQYQDPQSTQTLRQGLAEYRAANPGQFDAEQLKRDESMGELGGFFAAHDACHVLFGLDTSLADESLTDTWTLFGTDTTWRELSGFVRNPAQRQFLGDFIREIGWGKVVQSSLRAIPRILMVILRSRSMPRKWSFHQWPRYLDRPLNEIRREYGIRLV